jgi:hypothetical protein
MNSPDVLLHLYDRFNRHEFAVTDDLIVTDAVVECAPFRRQGNGAVGWRAFVARLATVFPDARIRAERRRTEERVL